MASSSTIRHRGGYSEVSLDDPDAAVTPEHQAQAQRVVSSMDTEDLKDLSLAELKAVHRTLSTLKSHLKRKRGGNAWKLVRRIRAMVIEECIGKDTEDPATRLAIEEEVMDMVTADGEGLFLSTDNVSKEQTRQVVMMLVDLSVGMTPKSKWGRFRYAMERWGALLAACLKGAHGLAWFAVAAFLQGALWISLPLGILSLVIAGIFVLVHKIFAKKADSETLAAVGMRGVRVEVAMIAKRQERVEVAMIAALQAELQAAKEAAAAKEKKHATEMAALQAGLQAAKEAAAAKEEKHAKEIAGLNKRLDDMGAMFAKMMNTTATLRE